VTLIARYAIGEAVRRRVFTIIVLLTVVFLALYGWGAFSVFDEVESQGFIGGELLEERTLTGATLVGLGMFVTFFLGVVLAVFMTMSAVRGDAERGVLQPLVVRPVGRRQVLLGRLAAAVAVASGYAGIVYAAIVLITWAAGDWTPDDVVPPAAALMGAVAIVTCLSVLGSIHLSGTANGIAVFMVFGAGLTAGLMNQIGEALNSDDLQRIADLAAILLPFEALYQAGLDQLTAETRGLTQVAVELGPFGGAEAIGPAGLVWALIYPVAVMAVAVRRFARLDL
jgi:ABC-type transport system involved in multi-copper enzyme maturation permease subunit